MLKNADDDGARAKEDSFTFLKFARQKPFFLAPE